jgi:hypothetical protein
MNGGTMKRTRGLIFFLAFCCLDPAIWGGQDPAAPSLPQPIYLMADIQVEVAKAPDYEAAMKALIAALRENAFPVLFDTYSTDDSRYYVVYGLEGYAGVDGLHSAWRDAAARMGAGRFQALQGRLTASEISRVLRFWTFRTDISYLPSPERLKPAEIGYYTWDYVWLVPGREAEFEALNKEWIALSKAKKSRDPFMTYQGGIGTDEPVYVWFEYGKSASDYALAEEAFWRALGAEGAALSKRTRALIRKQETKTGRYRPDLSYAPKR